MNDLVDDITKKVDESFGTVYLQDTNSTIFDALTDVKPIVSFVTNEVLLKMIGDMSKLLDTHLFDKRGVKISVGDMVAYNWGYRTDSKAKRYNTYRIHTVLLNINSEGKVFLSLSGCCNTWDTKDVEVITKKEIESMGIDIDTDFVLDDKGKAIPYNIFWRNKK